MREILRKIRKIQYPYNPLVRVLVFKNNIFYNLEEFSKYSKNSQNSQIAPVLKSNAYGHGLVLVAKLLDNFGLPFMVVDTFYEALVLKKSGIKTKVLIIGYSRSDNIYKNLLKNVSYTVISLEQLNEISANIRQKFTFHLKIDTGMHRQGLNQSELGQAVDIIKKNKLLSIEGLCSHLADSSNEDFSLAQIDSWNQIVDIVKHKLPGIKYYHLAATGGVIYSTKIKANIYRLGLGLYGLDSQLISKFDPKPSLSLRSIISSIKHIKPGDKIGYNRTFMVKKPMKMATVPIGYYEGIDLRLSNKGFFKVNNEFCPIIGRVSMNITTIDVSNIDEIAVGDEVVAISNEAQDKNSVQNIAKTIQTIPYEVLVKIPTQLRRHLV